MRPELVLVDDDLDHLELMSMALAACGVSDAVAFRDPGAAVAYLEERYLGPLGAGQPARPRIVLLDQRLGPVCGHEVLRQLRTAFPGAVLPIVMLSSSRLEDDVRRAYEGGANGYLRKPTTYGELVSLMRSVVAMWVSANRLPQGPAEPPSSPPPGGRVRQSQA